MFFPDWASCCNFVRDHIAKPVSVKDFPLCVHFVLQDMRPETSEVCRQPSVLHALKRSFRQVLLERPLDADICRQVLKNQLTLKCVDDSAGDVVQNGDEVVQRCKSSSSADQTCLNCVSVPLAFQLRTSVSLYRELGSRSLWSSACCVWRRLR